MSGRSLRFTRPEYRSYVDLMRRLKVDRVSEPGDCYVDCDRGEPWDAWQINLCHNEGAGNPDVFPDQDWEQADDWRGERWWLPRIEDWQELLDDAGVDGVTIELASTTVRGAAGYFARAAMWRPQLGFGLDRNPALGPTREEAHARLWMDLTGKADA